jgi:two-component system phosphate regulon response regulator PhoB
MAPVQMPNEERVAYRDAYLMIDYNRQAVTVDSRPVELTSKEFAMLAFLVGHAGEILPREELLAAVWGYNHQVRTRTLDVHLARVRKKLGPLGHRYIETVFGSGCRFQPQTATVRSVA